MLRSKSLSHYGGQLDRKNSTKSIHAQQLQTILHSHPPIQHHPKQPKVIQGFDRVTSRQKKSSFLTHNTKDFLKNANYQVKDNLVAKSAPRYSIKHQNDSRLSMLLPHQPHQHPQPTTTTCKKFIPSDGKQLLNTKQLQQSRKAFHSLDFTKQTSRQKLTQLNNKIQMEQTIESTKEQLGFNNTQSNINTIPNHPSNNDPMIKPQRVHSFGSYTMRDFLNPNKLKFAPTTSGIDFYKIPFQKFKSNWKMVSPLQFQKMAQINLSRYDRDTQFWNTKLQYNPKITKSKSKMIDFDKQTKRQINEVKSKYPIRIAI